MSTILVLDTLDVERNLICSLLSGDVHAHIESAASVEEAWDRITSAPPDILITELVLPSTDGMAFIRKVRQASPATQIVLMTSHGGEQVAAQALYSGAAGYVPKSMQAELLVGTVARLLDRIHADRLYERLDGCLVESYNTYQLPADRKLIKPLVNHLQQLLRTIGITDTAERMRIGVALEEAITNALVHGNLEIGAAEMSHAKFDLLSDHVERLVQQRQESAPYCERRVRVESHLTRDFVRFVVEDEGAGFDVAAVESTPLAESMISGKARGLILMRNFMDEVEYNDSGNRVTLRKWQPVSTTV